MGKRKAAEEEEVENEQPSWDRVEMERGGQPAEKRLRYIFNMHLKRRLP